MQAIPKPLLIVGGKPVLSHVVDFWKDKVDSFVFIVRREAMSYLWEYIPGNGAVVFQDEPKGLADAILRAEPYILNKCVIALGDCFQVGEFNWEPKDWPLAIGTWATENVCEKRKSYLVKLDEGLTIVEQLIEKPEETDGLCGMGTYFMDRRVFRYIRERLPYLAPGGGDFTDVLQYMADMGERIYPNYFRGKYINVNSPQDLAAADVMVA